MSVSAISTPPPRTTRPDRRRPTGPHLGALGLVSLGLTLAGLVTAALVAGGRPGLSPFAPTARLLDAYAQHPVGVRLGAMLLFGSAVPLGVFAATAHARLHRLGVRVPGPSIAFAGGLVASLMLMLSAASGWVLGSPGTGDAAVAAALSSLAFLTGGVGYATGLGLLVAGIAVPALLLRLVPRWIAWAGLAVAVVCELTFLAMLVDPVQVLVPVGRYAGLPWLVAVGFLLPTHRSAVRSDVAGEGR
jgi:hypothetical protein